jgi:hypothetical protein
MMPPELAEAVDEALAWIRTAEDEAVDAVAPTKVLMQLSAAKQAILGAKLGMEAMMGFCHDEA